MLIVYMGASLTFALGHYPFTNPPPPPLTVCVMDMGRSGHARCDNMTAIHPTTARRQRQCSTETLLFSGRPPSCRRPVMQ